MAANALIDTGTVLALLDKTDLWRQVSVVRALWSIPTIENLSESLPARTRL